MGFVCYSSETSESSAYAIDVDTAKENLAIAIDYIEKNNLTSGTIAIFFKEHGCDLSVWYETLVKGYQKLEEVSKDATFEEETLIIEKMRDSFIAVGLPEDIEDYPYNTEYFVWALSSFFGIPIFTFIAVWIHYNKKEYSK